MEDLLLRVDVGALVEQQPHDLDVAVLGGLVERRDPVLPLAPHRGITGEGAHGSGGARRATCGVVRGTRARAREAGGALGPSRARMRLAEIARGMGECALAVRGGGGKGRRERGKERGRAEGGK